MNGPGRLRLRARVLAGVLAITIVAFVAFDIGAIFELRGYLIGRTDTTLKTAVALGKPHLARLVAQAKAGMPTPVIEGAAGLGGYDYVAFIPPQGSTLVLESSGPTPRLPGDIGAVATSGAPHTVPSRHGTEQLRVLATRADGGIVVVAADLDDVNRTVGQLALIVFVGSAAAILFIAVGVVVVVTRGLRPLETMADQADQISAGDLSHRVDARDETSEVGRLATALNEMLARIDSFVGQQAASKESTRRFLADASHELRTPLASVRAMAELYRQGALTERSDVDEAMRRISLESERMSRLVDDMLRLVRFDQRPSSKRERVDVSALVTACVERVLLANGGRDLDIRVDQDLVVMGDRELLSRAVDNLLANVATHTPQETRAAVSATRAGPSIVVEVTDEGPGVPNELLPHIFERFYRAGGRSEKPGSGLGLAIVADIAAAHDGLAEAVPNGPRGLLVRLTVPSVDAVGRTSYGPDLDELADP